MPLEFEIVKHVTLPLLKISEDGTPVHVRFEGVIFKAEKIEGSRAAKTAEDGSKIEKAPPELAHVTNLQNGEPAQIICNAVLAAELRKTYKDDAYVGKMFQIRRLKMATGKNYATFEILEIRLKEKPQPVAGKKSA